MTNVGSFIAQAKLSCESCEFEAENAGAAMVHAMTIGHTLSGETPEGDTVTISITEE